MSIFFDEKPKNAKKNQNKLTIRIKFDSIQAKNYYKVSIKWL